MGAINDEKLQLNIGSYTYYNAYGLLKHLIRKERDNYISRYDERLGLTVRDPVSGQRILDEVQFFEI
jgi:hypothetical protein